MAFPTSPVDGQIYKDYSYDSINSVWKKNILNVSSLKQTSFPSFSGVGLPSHTGYANSNYIPKTIVHDVGSNFNSSTGEFTCPLEGLYLVMFNSLVVTNYTSTGHASIKFFLNSNVITHYLHTMYNISRIYEPVSMISSIKANVGDIITCKVQTEYGAALWGGTTNYTSMAISFVR